MLTALPLFTTLAISAPHVILLVAIVLLLFGGKKIPEMMRGLGRGVKEFKDAVNKDYTAEDHERRDETPKQIQS